MSNVVPFAGGQLRLIPLDKIIEDPFLPRKSYSLETLKSLGQSMSDKGLMQPIVASEIPEGFRLMGGGRRVRAARAAGFTEIWAIVRDDACPQDVMILALTENVQREDLEPLEEANAYLWLNQEYGLEIKDIASNVHKSQGHVRDRLKLLDLAPEVQRLVADEELTASTAAMLAHIQSGEQQLDMAREIMHSNLSAENVRTLIREEGQRPIEGRPGRILTVKKYGLHLVRTREEVERRFAVIEKSQMTAEERGRLIAAMGELEESARALCNRLIEGGRYVISKGHVRKTSGNVPTARSHGAEWPAGHVKLLEDPKLSDEDIAEEIGRTVSAVAAMRKELRRTKKRGAR
jgi:ParB family chromosome partitioning protein